jgi:predicted RNA-binding Zn-ribbon protein involved in translation (DUF1610 family)
MARNATYYRSNSRKIELRRQATPCASHLGLLPMRMNDSTEGKTSAREESSTDEETTTACPHCGSTNFHARNGRCSDAQTRHYCNDCKTGFDEPVERERQSSPGLRPNTLAAQLEQADPEEVASDG